MHSDFYYEVGSENVFHMKDLLNDVINAKLKCQYTVPTAGIPIYTYTLLDQEGMPISTIPDGILLS